MGLGRKMVGLGGLAAVMVGVLLGVGFAQDDRDRDRDRPAPPVAEPGPNGEAEPPGGPERFKNQPRDRRRGENEQGTEEGMAPRIAPHMAPVPPRIVGVRWRLGVYAVNTDTGVRITQVAPNSPAWQSGLEVSDVIVTVDGYQIGYVNGRLYDLASELQRRAGHAGRVSLLVQNHRNNELVPMDVRLERVGWPEAQPFRQR